MSTDAYCTISGMIGNKVECSFAMVIADAEMTWVTGMQFMLNFDVMKLRFDGWIC